MAAELRILQASHAVVQDLGRRRVSHFGVSANGAADEYSARIANVLVGNLQSDPLIEVLASSLSFTTTERTAVAVTGAPADITLDGSEAPAWAPFRVPAGSTVTIGNVHSGLRSYVAIAGELHAPRFLDSVAPDRALGFGCHLQANTALGYEPRTAWREIDSLARSRVQPEFGSPWTLDVCVGPEWDEFGSIRDDILSATLDVHPQSNHVGTRLTGTLPTMKLAGELSSRGVAIGAVEITPAQELVMLHRGRSITAGYPVVLVVTAAALSNAGQLRPSDQVRFRLISPDRAVKDYRRQRSLIDGLEQGGWWRHP